MFFDGVFLSLYSHLLKKLDLSKLSRNKSYGALKTPKMAFFYASYFFHFLNIQQGRYLIKKKYSFYFTLLSQ